MKNKHLQILSIMLLTLGLSVNILQAFSTGPPNQRTGAPGELTCQNGCHSSFALNSGMGSVAIEDAPTEYLPGETYTITVHVMHPSQHRWGFELCSRTGSLAQGGTITVTEPTLTQTSAQSGITYLKHRSAGTFNGQTSGATWHFDWTAPADGTGAITFYTAGNAANGNGNNTGDYIYTTAFTVNEGINCIATGDVNFDTNVDVLDIVAVVGVILGNAEFSPEQMCAADLNGDSGLDVLDVVALVSLILG